MPSGSRSPGRGMSSRWRSASGGWSSFGFGEGDWMSISDMAKAYLKLKYPEFKAKGFYSFLREIMPDLNEGLYFSPQIYHFIPDGFLCCDRDIYIFEIEDTNLLTKYKLINIFELWDDLQPDFDLHLMIVNRYGNDIKEYDLQNVADFWLESINSQYLDRTPGEREYIKSQLGIGDYA